MQLSPICPGWTCLNSQCYIDGQYRPPVANLLLTTSVSQTHDETNIFLPITALKMFNILLAVITFKGVDRHEVVFVGLSSHMKKYYSVINKYYSIFEPYCTVVVIL